MIIGAHFDESLEDQLCRIMMRNYGPIVVSLSISSIPVDQNISGAR